MATVVFIGIAAMPEDVLLSWGWRLPFWFSAVLMVVGLIVRRTVRDTDAFTEQKEHEGVVRVPLGEVLRKQPLDLVRVILASLLLVISTTVPVYGLTYATNTAGVEASTMLWVVMFGYAISLVTQPLLASLSDRIGRKPVLIAGNLLGAVAVWLFFWAIGAHNVPMMFVGMFLTIGFGYAGVNGVYPSFFAEMFSTRYRVTGMAVGLQIGLVLTGFSPLIIQALSSANGDAWWPAAALTSIALLVSTVTIATARETFRTPLDELGVNR